MGISHFNFGQLIRLSEGVFEVIIDEGIEIDREMMNAYHAYFREHASGPFVVLVNRKNAYTYTIEVQQNIGHMPGVKAFAVLVYSRLNEISTQFVKSLPSNKNWNLEIFHDREEALGWLRLELRKHQ